MAAQPTLDTINQALKEKPHLFAQLDTRNSFIENSRAQIVGIKAGLRYGKRVMLGIGYSQFYNGNPYYDKLVQYIDEKNHPVTIVAGMHLAYVTAEAEYVFFNPGKWKLSMPLQFGIGRTSYSYDNGVERVVIDKKYNFIYEPSVSVEYQFFKWTGVGVDIGYRILLTDDTSLIAKMTSPTYAFNFIIYYNELYHSIFRKQKKGST